MSIIFSPRPSLSVSPRRFRRSAGGVRARPYQPSMARDGIVVIVAAGSDDVARAVGHRLRAERREMLTYEPHELAGVRVSLSAERFLIEGNRVSSIFWRVAPVTPFSTDFEISDQSFADAETAAVWLGALHAPRAPSDQPLQRFRLVRRLPMARVAQSAAPTGSPRVPRSILVARHPSITFDGFVCTK